MLDEVKVVIIGPVAVGKSSLATRFIFNQFNENMPTTLGAAYFEKMHEYGQGKTVKYQFWDTAGQQKFKALAKIYYKDAKVAIVMYDVTSRETFQGMKNWMKELRQTGPSNMIVAVVGNKIDLLEEAVSLQEGQQFAISQNAIFKLTSAKQDKGIRDLFDAIAIRLQNLNNVKETNPAGEKLGNKKGGKKKKKDGECC